MDNSMPRVKEKYLNEVMPHLKEKLARSNPMSLPKILKVSLNMGLSEAVADSKVCLLYTSPSPRDGLLSRMPSSA